MYQETEHAFKVSEALPLKQFIEQVKVHYNIAADAPLSIINMDGDDNTYFAPTLTEHFWVYSSINAPRYKIVTVESKKKYPLFVKSMCSYWSLPISKLDKAAVSLFAAPDIGLN